MYQAHFHLAEEAFSLSPDPRFIYFTAQHKEALYKTEYAITQKKGISAIYGDIGAGKTSLARGAFGHSNASRSRCWYRINTLSRVPLYLAHRSANI
jgi:general secretion pathway protein A